MRFQLGHNLHSPANRSEGFRKFFRGWLDEVFVFDEALTYEQVRALMQTNRCDGLTPTAR